jgi:hypothetical protein
MTKTEPPRELVRELGSLGMLGMHLRGYGCASLDRHPGLPVSKRP